MKRLLFFLCLFFLPVCAHAFECVSSPFLAADSSVDLYCLASSHPQIRSIETASDGKTTLHLASGSTVPYNSGKADGLSTDLATAMQAPYPLDGARPDTPQGVAPGRKRAYDFLAAIYGSSPEAARKNTRSVNFLGKKLTLAAPAAAAFERAIPALLKNRSLLSWLAPEGGFYWRKIAGENVLSAHSFGIAIDLGVKKAPYWRWSKIQPHPLQKTYPSEIVAALEDQGFIWGGKWHEYDLMHFEYRPEIICKAKIRRAHGRNVQ